MRMQCSSLLEERTFEKSENLSANTELDTAFTLDLSAPRTGRNVSVLSEFCSRAQQTKESSLTEHMTVARGLAYLYQSLRCSQWLAWGWINYCVSNVCFTSKVSYLEGWEIEYLSCRFVVDGRWAPNCRRHFSYWRKSSSTNSPYIGK